MSSTTTPCPPWCTEPAGHPYGVEDPEDPDTRMHIRTLLDNRATSVDICQTERVHLSLDGVRVELEPLAVNLDADGLLDMSQVEELMAVLLTAVEEDLDAA